ncbi:hypothetical protein Q0F99_09425 [Rathayibacter oskolensis]|nr:hypothetical protein [Rathayibacter oskolensis]WKK73042.1 hypothetical protein Q0F99_09425 [Rathayibacter oskolensis]
MVTTERPGEPFLAAGAPWFFTLFGRDSIWAARMLLPLGTELAASTLRVLAGLQGTRHVAETAEQPGKIMHELRATTLEIPGEGVSLPPLYFGTVDATALWVCLLHDAWRWGMPDDEVEALLPTSRRHCAGCARTATPTATGSSSTSTPPGTVSPTRAGRTPATRSSGATARSPRVRSRSARCRRTPTRRSAEARRCSSASVATAPSGAPTPPR